MHDTFAFHHTNQATKKKKKTGDTMPQTDPNTHLEVHLAGIEPASIPPPLVESGSIPAPFTQNAPFNHKLNLLESHTCISDAQS